MKEFGPTGLPVTHVENASATGLVAFRDAPGAAASGVPGSHDKMTEMAQAGAAAAAVGRDAIDSVIPPAAHFPPGHAAHAERAPGRTFRRDRREELELRRRRL